MKVIALGGSGGMGRFAVRAAVGLDFTTDVVVADLDGDRAAALVASCGAKARAIAIDVADGAALEALLSEADVVLNTVGPFFRFGLPILRAAIAAHCHYLDINDDWEPTLEMLALDAEARAAGITAIVGMGASPGVSNLLAVSAMRELDTVDDLVTGWGLGGTGAGDERSERGETPAAGPESDAGRPNAALVHWMHQCSGTIRIYRNGGFVDVPPVEEIELDYPGIGRAAAWTVGHPEPVTLASFRPGLRSSCNVMVAPRPLIEIVRGVAREIDAGRLDAEQAAALLAQPAGSGDGRGRRASQGEPPTQSEPRLPPLFALASGTHEGKPARVGAMVLGMPAGGMGGSTGVPLALGLSLFAKGQIERRGVFAPEGAIEPDSFFDALAPHCSRPFESGRQMILLTRSWQR
jgi:saccharopine dehydrogenase-like NADP-dependent oxidoreductase